MTTPVLALALAIVVLGARVAQSMVHIALEQSQAVIAVRSLFFAAQAFSMLGMAWLVFDRA